MTPLLETPSHVIRLLLLLTLPIAVIAGCANQKGRVDIGDNDSKVVELDTADKSAEQPDPDAWTELILPSKEELPGYFTLSDKPCVNTELGRSKLVNMEELGRGRFVRPSGDKRFLIYYSFSNSIDDEKIVYLRDLVELREIDLGSTDITDSGLSNIAGLRNLKQINLAGCKKITDDGLLHLKENKQLEGLGLQGLSNVSGSGISRLQGLSHLTTLILRNTGLRDNDIAKLKVFPNLQHLDLQWVYITDVGLGHLKDMVSLTHLDLGSCGAITDEGIIHFGKLSKLRFLSLHGIRRTSDTSLKTIGKLQELTHLYLGYSGISDAGLGHLSALTKLTHLSLMGCKQIRGVGLKSIGLLSNLQNLNLQELDFRDESTDFSHLSYLSNLNFLGLLRSRGMTASRLAGLQKLPALRTLNLASTDISDEGLSKVGKLLDLTNIDLYGCNNITDAGLTYLYSLTNLKKLTLHKCAGLTELGVADLKSKLSGCKIRYWN